MQPSRRRLLKSALVGTSTLTLPAIALPSAKQAKARVVVIGGGFAGATAAKYLSMWSPNTEVILVEKNSVFVSCPQSNLVLSGTRSLQSLTHDYHDLIQRYGIQLVQASVTAVDADNKKIRLHDGVELEYDRLVIAPGIDFIYDHLPMMTEQVVNESIPHAWKAGPQTALLYQQLMAMPDNGTVVMTIPATPYRCPPGPYERSCQMAFYLKRNKPKAKLVILDANGGIVSKKALFTDAWQKYYSSTIEYLPSNNLETVDVKTRTVESAFDSIQADVLNIIPPQKAGKVAELTGVVNRDGRWCEVDFTTYESTVKKHIHVIGDAVASTLPKSGHIANMQAKVCAAAISAILQDQVPEQMPVFGNTCYSFVSDREAGHVAAVFRYNAEQKNMVVMPGGGASNVGSESEARFAYAWATNIWSDTLE